VAKLFILKDTASYHLMHFDYFNNSFVLNRPIGKCTRHQLDGLNDLRTPDLSALTICICCDEYSPSAILGCPADPWNNGAVPTPAPQSKFLIFVDQTCTFCVLNDVLTIKTNFVVLFFTYLQSIDSTNSH
jgi:hypothetical protein